MAFVQISHGTRFGLAGAIAAASVFFCANFAAPAHAADEAGWSGWAELGGYLGGDKGSRGEAAVFLPLIQDDDGLVFADVRGKIFEDDISEVNLAAGYRQMLPSGVNLGAWAGADKRLSEQGNVFWAASGGLEALWENFDARLNGYLALSDDKTSPASARASIQGGQIFLTGSEEIPLSGFDGEIGARVPLELAGLEQATNALRVYAGGFYFDADNALREVSGPKARLEYRIEDVIAALPGSRLALEGEWRSDEVRGGYMEAGLRFRIPFSVFSGNTSSASARSVHTRSEQWRRMVDGLERDTDIVTAPSGREAVEDALTNVRLDRVVHADATTGITAPAATAGSNTLIAVDGAAGPVTGAQTVQANQTLVGGGGSIQVRGQTTGVVATLTAPGQRPTFANAANTPTLTLADRTQLAGVNVTGNTLNFGNDGVSIGSSQFVVLQDVDVQNVGGAGVLAADNNRLTLRNVRMTNLPGGPGLVVNNGNTVSVSDSRIDMAAFGVVANDENTISVMGTTIANICGDGIQIDDDNALTLSGVGFSNVCGNGVTLDNRNMVAINGSTFEGIGFDAIVGAIENTLTVSNSTVRGTGEEFLDLAFGNTATVTNTNATGLGGKGIGLLNGNTLNVTGGSISSQGEGLDTNDNNTITLTNTTIASVGGGEGIDISDNNRLTLTGSTISSAANNALEITFGNIVTVNMSVLAGTPTSTVSLEGGGNLLSGSGNVDNSAPTVAFCSNLGGVQAGSIGFTNGASCP